MRRHSREALRTLFVGVLVLALSTSGASAALAGSGPGAAPAQVGTVELSEEVDAWERAALPLRTTPSDDGAAVENRRMLVRLEERDVTTPLQKDALSVYAPDETVELRFRSRMGADTSEFGGETVDLVVAKLDADSSLTDETGSVVAVLDAVDRLTSGSANDEATFEERPVTLDADGEATVEYDPDEPGRYVFMLARPEANGGLEVTDGDIRTAGNATVVGVDTAMVASASASVDAPGAVVRGTSAEFDVNANLEADATNHSLVLYHESRYTESQTRTVVESELRGDLSEADVTVEHTIEGVNGVVDADAPVRVGGTTVGDGVRSSYLTATSLPDFVDARASEGERDGRALDASLAAVADADDAATLTVETVGNWTPGAYRYLYVAEGESANDVSAATGTLRVRASSGGGGGGGGGGAGPGPTLPPTVSERSALVDPGSNAFDAAFPSGSSFSRFRIEFRAATDGSVTVGELASVPRFAGRVNGASAVAVANVEVPFNARDEPATVQATVRQRTLQEAGASPSALRIERYNDAAGEWQTLNTTVVREGSNTVVVEAQTPGFSVFAVTVAGSAGTPGTATPASEPTATPGEPAPTTAAPVEPTATPAQPGTTVAAASPVEEPPSERGGLDPVPFVAGLFLVAAVLLAAYLVRE